MDDDKYIKTLFKRNTYIESSNDCSKDVTFIVSNGVNELYNIVRDCLLKRVNGSCIYCSNDNEVFFTVSKKDMGVLEEISKKIKRDKRIRLEKVLLNTRKINSYLHTKKG